MSARWHKVKFAEICEHSAFGPRFPSDLYSQDGNVATLRTTDISEDGRIEYRTMPIAQIELTKFRHHFLQEGDLVITRSGRVGTTAVFKFFPKPVLPGAFLIRFRLKREIAEPEFFQYFFNSTQGQQLLTSVATGSAQQNLKISSLHTLEIPVPPLAEQREIARILGTLDDKIELNRRMNATLEGIARAIFKSWFVDFDPVHAKARGEQPYGMAAETAALFPDSFEDSELGPIPAGWGVKALDAIAHFQNGLALQKYPPEGDEYLPVIKIRELRQGHSDDRSDKASPNIREECVLYDGDIVFSWSGSLLVDIWCDGKAALNQHLFKVTSKKHSKWLYYYWTLHHLDEFQRIAADKATTMGHIKRGHLSAAMVAIPPRDLLDRADEVIAPYLEAQINNRLQARTLSELRDALLPKLISGEMSMGEFKYLGEKEHEL